MKSGFIRLLTRLLIAVFVGSLILALAWGYCIYQDVDQLRQIAGSAKALKTDGLQVGDLPGACDLAFRAAPAVDQLKSDLSPVWAVAPGLERAPNMSRYLLQARLALDYLDNLSQGGVILCHAGLPLWQDLSQEGIGAAFAPGFADRLTASMPDLLQAKSQLEQASEDAGRIDLQLIPVEYRDDFTRLNAAIPLTLHALDAAPEIPAALELINDARAIQDRGLDADLLSQVNGLAIRAEQVSGNLKEKLQPITPLLRELDPGSQVGPYFSQADLLMDYINCLARAGASLSQVALALQEEDAVWDDEVNGQPGWYQLLVANQAEIADVQDWLKKAAEIRARIDMQRLPVVYQSRLAATDQLFAQAPSILAFLQTVPRLAGADGPQTYLITAQNRDELRATGGYITAFGLLQFDSGRISSLNIEGIDSNYMSEERSAPEPMRYIMDAYYLVPRDANWSPDFPTAAKEVQEIYALSVDDVHTDGMIAFDQGLLASLLEFLGPLVLPDGTKVDAGNVQAVMVQYKEAAANAGQGDKRKEFMAVMAPLLIDRIKTTRQPQRQIELFKLLYQQVQQGHLQIFFNDLQAQQTLHSLGLDSAVRPGEGDFLMLIDSNMGFSKVDAFIERSVEYEVDLGDPQILSSTVHIKYQHGQAGTEPCHQGVADRKDPASHHYYFSRCYWNYWRLLTANDTNLISAQFDPIPPSYFDDNKGWKNEVATSVGENGTEMLAGLLVVPQGQAKEVVLNTHPSSKVLTAQDGNRLVYRLRIQKQAGIERLSVEVRVTGPRGYLLPSPPPGWNYDQAQNLAIWKGNIYGLQDISLEFTR